MARHSAAFVKLDEEQDNQYGIEPFILPGVKFVSGLWMATFQFEMGFVLIFFSIEHFVLGSSPPIALKGVK